jgi:Fe-S cluster biogenesis protein NfuA
VDDETAVEAGDTLMLEELAKVVVPLVTIDNAEVYVVTATASEVHLHLAGAYSGCPGRALVERALLAPAVRNVFPKAKLKVTSGLPIPKEARRAEGVTKREAITV